MGEKQLHRPGGCGISAKSGRLVPFHHVNHAAPHDGKGLILCKEDNGLLVYSPLLDQESATHKETSSFLSRVYHGSIGMMLSAMTQKQGLSQQEIDQLYAILKEAEKHD